MPELFDETKPIYRCAFVNKSSKPVSVDENGKRLVRDIPSGRTFDVEMDSPNATYAPFSRVVYTDEAIKTERNPKWERRWPEGTYPIEIINSDGNPLEMLYLHGQKIECYLGIPRFSWVELGDPYLYYSKLELVKREHKVLSGNYWAFEMKNDKLRTLRPKKELEEIQRRLEERALAGLPKPELPADVKEALR